MLQELHRAGLLDDAELQAKRAALDERSPSRHVSAVDGRAGAARNGPSAVSPQPPSSQMYVSHVSVRSFGAVGDAAARLAEPLRAAAARARARSRRHSRARPRVEHLELVPLGHRALVDVAAEDQLGARGDEAREHVVAARDRLLARAPRRVDQLVVEGDDAQRARCGLARARSARARVARRRRRPTGGATGAPS